MQSREDKDECTRMTIPFDPGKGEDGSIATMSRLKTSMHRASKKEQPSDNRPVPPPKRRVTFDKSVRHKAKFTGNKPQTKSRVIRQQILIANLQHENAQLQINLRSSLEETRHLRRMLQNETHRALNRNRSIHQVLLPPQIKEKSPQQERQVRVIPHHSTSSFLGGQAISYLSQISQERFQQDHDESTRRMLSLKPNNTQSAGILSHDAVLSPHSVVHNNRSTKTGPIHQGTLSSSTSLQETVGAQLRIQRLQEEVMMLERELKRRATLRQP